MNIKNTMPLIVIILIGVSLLTTLFLETKIGGKWAIIEGVIILAAMIAAALIFFGFWLEENWPYALSIFFFSAGTANFILMLALTNRVFAFMFGVLVSIAGVVVCVAGMERQTPIAHVDDYPLVQTYGKQEKLAESSKNGRGRPKKSK